MPVKEEISTPNLTIRFTGKAVEQGEMSAQDLGNALVAMSSLVKATEKAMDSHLGLDITVKDVKKGSYIIELAQLISIIEHSYPFLIDEISHNAVYNNILNLLLESKRGFFELTNFLKGLTLDSESINIKRGGKIINIDEIENNDDSIDIESAGNIFRTTGRIIRFFANKDIREFAWDFIKILSKKGIDKIQFCRPDGEDIEVKKDDVKNFEYKKINEEIPESIFREKVTIKIISPHFDENGQWDLVDENGKKFKAKITDSGFLEKVKNHRPFSKGDFMICNIKEESYCNEKGKIKKTNTITDIYKHHHIEPQQNDLPFSKTKLD